MKRGFTILSALLIILVIVGCQQRTDRFSVKDDTAVVVQGQSVDINVTKNDTYYFALGSETETHVVIKAIASTPQKGTVVINSANNTITYTANSTATGDDNFRYFAYATGKYSPPGGSTRDFNTTQKSANVVVHITEAPNAKPVAEAQTVEINCYVSGTPSITIALTGNDADGDSLTYHITSQPTYGTLSAINGNSVTYTDSNTSNSICSGGVQQEVFKFKVNDGLQDSDEVEVTIVPAAG